jgi:hypothetical protein
MVCCHSQSFEWGNYQQNEVLVFLCVSDWPTLLVLDVIDLILEFCCLCLIVAENVVMSSVLY